MRAQATHVSPGCYGNLRRRDDSGLVGTAEAELKEERPRDFPSPARFSFQTYFCPCSELIFVDAEFRSSLKRADRLSEVSHITQIE